MGLRGLFDDIVALLLTPIRWIVYGLDWLIGRIESIIGQRRMPYFFVLPNMLIFFIFVLTPVLLNFWFGFTAGNSILPEQRPWVGTENFQRLSTCADYLNYKTCREEFFWRAVGNSAIFVVFEVAGMVLMALVIALALNRDIRLRGFFRSAFFYPVLLSPVVVALIWKWILQERGGLLNSVLQLLGLKSISFLTDAGWMMFWVIFVSIWAQVGFYALILLAGLQAIPPSLYEAAKIDGAHEGQSFRSITLPLLRPTLLVVLVLSLIRGAQSFDHIFVLSGGGPGTATVLMVQYIYRTAFEPPNNWGLGAAASLVLAAVLAVLTLGQLYLNRRQTEAI
jgi:alpha-1,4-digalacturonate transport system permease protein